jgi:hypothetical protein
MSGLGSTIVAPGGDLLLETGQSKLLDTRTFT